MPSAERYPARRHVAWRAIDTEALVVDPKAGLLYPLNSVAARIWELCDGARTVEAIIDIVAEEFDAPRATITADTNEFLEALAASNLIRLDDKPQRPASRPEGREA